MAIFKIMNPEKQTERGL